MIRSLIIGLLMTTLALAGVQILQTDGKRATIPASSMPRGTSGVVIHHFDSQHATIVARAILEGPTTITFAVYDALAQPNLPKPKLLPQVGDEVLLGYLYHRAIAIAPDYPSYQELTQRLPLQWVHPDLFAAELAKAKHPIPSKEDFHDFCNKFALAKVVIALEEEARVLDCYTFATLERIPLKARSRNPKHPFYTRIAKIKGSIFDFFKPKEIQDYYTYYHQLVEGK
ncbi:MAG: hypothetical protein GXO38_01315 [Epsilonproteobacteria bacterium]|nr:hypothetical protein [Campylobacterota bacterium]